VPVELRARTPDDIEALATVAARVQASDGYPHYLPDQDFVRFLTRPEPLCSWVAEIDSTVVGHVAITAGTSSPAVMELVRDDGIEGDVVFIARLLVDPNVRRRGIGTRLLKHARREAIARGSRPALEVVLAASAAISLYRAADWREIGRTMLTLPDGRELEEVVFLGPDQ
jgi:ribosomal protein S18 acetylase RimI-like enzyme